MSENVKKYCESRIEELRALPVLEIFVSSKIEAFEEILKVLEVNEKYK